MPRADAVYIGGEAFGLRAKAKNFSKEDMVEGIKFAHERDVKVYVTANILAHNVELATQICKNPLDVDEVIEAVGLKERSSNFPAQLSGGEQQRVAIARALAKNPKLLLCDEPTGALDYNTGKQILKLLQDTCRERGVTVVVITHNLALTAMGDKVIKVKNGVVDSVTVNENPLPIEQIEW